MNTLNKLATTAIASALSNINSVEIAQMVIISQQHGLGYRTLLAQKRKLKYVYLD